MCDDRNRFHGHESNYDRGHGYGERHEGSPRHFNENIYRPSNMTAPFPRRFISNAEFLEFLKTYLKEVEQEAQGVREAIAELEAEMSKEQESEA